jgi:natural product biosynthesis luciferase-like monooxygenase protein
VIDPTVYEDRKAVMYERIDQVRALWRGEPLTFSDAKGGETTVRTLPRPVQAELPVWVTAAGNPETFREAGARGANLLTHLLGQTVDELGEKIAIYRAARAEHGFDPSAGIVTIMLHTFVGEDDASVRETVRGPMREYLRSSIGLIKKAAWSFPAFKDKTTGADGRFTTERLSDDDMEQVLDFSFERYYETSGLFGTPERCLEQVEELRQRGVDEIACLLDFGLDAKRVVDHLPLLAEVRQRARRAARSENTASAETRSVSRTLMPQAETDYSIAAQIERHDVTHLQCTPSQARMLMADPAARSALSQLDHLMVGGEALPVELAKRLRSQVPGKLTNMYGPTETTIWSTTHHIEGVDGAVPIGRPIANTQIYILNDDRAPVPIGVPGELYIGGDGVTHGYLHRDQLTAERFLEDPFRTGGRMYRAGDLARYRPDGVIEFLGREDFQVKIRGHRIELGEIEATLERYDDIRAAVVTAQVRNDVKELVGYIVLASGGEALSAVDLRNRLRDSVPEFMIPTHLVVLDQLPLTPNGKVDRKALPKPGGQVGVEDRGFEAARNEVERKIIAIWEEVLDVQHIDRNGHFFDLGGNSLVALRLMDTMKTELGVGLPLRSIFDAPRVRDLATLIQEERVQTVGAERLSTVLEEVEQLSDDEVKRLLDS